MAGFKTIQAKWSVFFVQVLSIIPSFLSMYELISICIMNTKQYESKHQ